MLVSLAFWECITCKLQGGTGRPAYSICNVPQVFSICLYPRLSCQRIGCSALRFPRHAPKPQVLEWPGGQDLFTSLTPDRLNFSCSSCTSNLRKVRCGSCTPNLRPVWFPARGVFFYFAKPNRRVCCLAKCLVCSTLLGLHYGNNSTITP